MRSKNRLIQGWGVNDVNYCITKSKVIEGKQKIIWICPYFKDWVSMIRRVFDNDINSTYKSCTIDPDWKYLSNFIKWVDSQPNRDWQNCSPDKDILFVGNKHYGPTTVVYITKKLNTFVTGCNRARGQFMIGVSPHTLSKRNPYQSHCSNPFTNKREYLGLFSTELEAHLAWKAKKHEHALQLAKEQDDPHVAQALRERYAPDKDWTNQ